MTSEEIKNVPKFGGGATSEAAHVVAWLKEIAYQLSVMNERKAAEPGEAAEREFHRLVARLPKVE